MGEPVSMTEAARRLRLTFDDTFDLVFSRQLRSVESPSGRRLVPVEAITDWLAEHGASA